MSQASRYISLEKYLISLHRIQGGLYSTNSCPWPESAGRGGGGGRELLSKQDTCLQGRIQGGSPGGQDPPPPFGGPPNFIKMEKKHCTCARKECRISVLNSYPDPPPPLSEILYPPLLFYNQFNSCISNVKLVL